MWFFNALELFVTFVFDSYVVVIAIIIIIIIIINNVY